MDCRYKMLKEHRCPVCGRRFSIPYKHHKDWQYQLTDKRKTLYLCSYACYQENC